MHSFYAQACIGDVFQFSLEDEKHQERVLRLHAGVPLYVVYDGARYEATYLGQGKAQKGKVLPSTEPKARITLYQGITKGERMDYTVQKCTEIGVFRIVPVVMERCVVKDADKKIERWQRIALEAGKQSKRTHIPQVTPPMSFEDMANALSRHEQALVPWEEAVGSSLRAVYRGAVDVAVAIGPEGGITENEIQQMPATPITLGPRILRAETAGLVTAAGIFLLSGDLA